MKPLINDLIEKIGPGTMPSTAYDTAWAARLSELEPSLGVGALNWLDAHQLADGSWGADAPVNYFDRVISTLAAMISLTKYGGNLYREKQVGRGLQALEKMLNNGARTILADPAKSTIGFEMIVPTLVAEAEKLGIIKQHGESILKTLDKLRKAKLSRIMGKRINKNTTMAFSAEIAGEDGIDMLDIENLQESNGSVGHSPSATAYFALQVRQKDARAMEYLSNTIRKDGGLPNVASFNAFEISWTLWNLRLIPGFEASPRARALLDTLSSAWKPGRGIGFATEYSVLDSDMTSLVFDTLAQYGYEKDIESILSYEEQDHFRCYPMEANPSVSANIHVLGALRRAGFGRDHASIQKVIRFLEQIKGNNPFWVDKWHSSPYYTTSHAIMACAGYANDTVRNSVDWIISSQRPNGAWGAVIPTAEETAYAIQALWVWNQYGGKIDCGIIGKGAEWLEAHSDGPYPPLWIGKCLYSPSTVIRSAVISALSLAKQV